MMHAANESQESELECNRMYKNKNTGIYFAETSSYLPHPSKRMATLPSYRLNSIYLKRNDKDINTYKLYTSTP